MPIADWDALRFQVRDVRAEDVGSRVSWMIGRGENKAELVLTPPHLGKLEVSIQTNGEITTAHFVAASAAARDALEQALPRLREVLQQAGINLGQTNVSTSSEQQARQDSSGQSGASLRYAAGLNETDDSASMPTRQSFWMQTGTGMVDTFA
jgi:flagellar hook-length control protein FliK